MVLVTRISAGRRQKRSEFVKVVSAKNGETTFQYMMLFIWIQIQECLQPGFSGSEGWKK